MGPLNSSSGAVPKCPICSCRYRFEFFGVPGEAAGTVIVSLRLEKCRGLFLCRLVSLSSRVAGTSHFWYFRLQLQTNLGSYSYSSSFSSSYYSSSSSSSYYSSSSSAYFSSSSSFSSFFSFVPLPYYSSSSSSSSFSYYYSSSSFYYSLSSSSSSYSKFKKNLNTI